MNIKTLTFTVLIFLIALNTGAAHASSESIPYQHRILQDIQQVLKKHEAAIEPNSVVITGGDSDMAEFEIKFDFVAGSGIDEGTLLDTITKKMSEAIFNLSPTETLTVGPVRYNSSETIEEISALHEQGDELATMRLAERYKGGRSVQKDMPKACLLYGEAFLNGLPDIYEDILDCMAEGYYTRLNANDAEEVIKIAAREYNYNVASFLGEHFYNGYYIQENKLRAKTLFEQAENDGIALNYLGIMYQDGEVVKKDLFKARQYFKDASAEGEPLAMYHLANSYISHESIGLELDLAYYWMRESALKEYPPAILEYAKMLLRNGAEYDPLESLIYFKKASEMGLEDANCYISEISVKLYKDEIDPEACAL